MTLLDWLLVSAIVLSAITGAQRGFVAGVLSLIGFLGGAFAGARLAPLLLSGGSSSPWAPLLGLAGALALGFALSTLLSGIGGVVMDALPLPAFGTVDLVLGAVFGAAVALAVAWIAGAVALQTPGARELREEVRRSTILSALNDALPPSGPILSALARFDPLPSITGPSPDNIEKPSQASLSQPGARRAIDGTVRVLGEACGLGTTGSGWIAAPGIVVTNAHVVAGTESDLLVQLRGEAERREARAVRYDPRQDVAVLRVDGLGGTVLRPVKDPRPGTEGAILGYPLNGPFDARPARIGETQAVLANDAYGRGPVRRRMTAIRGNIRSGNSGGPVVDAQGRVLTTVFASSEGGGAKGGFGLPNDVVADAVERGRAAPGSVSTGPCAH